MANSSAPLAVPTESLGFQIWAKALDINPEMMVEVMKLLRTYEKEPSKLDKYGRSLLHYATWFADDDVATNLLKQDNVATNPVDQNGKTPLHFAAKNRSTSVLTALLAREDIQFLSDMEGKTALHDAVIQKNLPVVLGLLKHPACKTIINNLDKNGKSALHYAVELNQADIVEQLVKVEGINVNLPTSDGLTALALAGRESFGSVAGELIKCPNLEGNLRDKKDQNAVEWAKKNGNYAVAVDTFLKKYMNIYQEKRSKEPDYKHFWGALFGGASKQEKMDAAKFVFDHFDEKQQMKTRDDFKQHEKALVDGSELGTAFNLSL